MKIDHLTENSWVATGLLPEELQLDEHLYNSLWEMRPNERHTIKLFGKHCTLPREQIVYGVDNYTYSGKVFPSQAIPPVLQTYLDWTNKLELDIATKNKTNYIPYNMILVNWYHDGTDYIGAHRDDEKQIILQSNVMTISFGAERKFRVRHIPIKGDIIPELSKKDYIVTNNSFLIMGGHFQDEFKHEVPKTKKVFQSRISITLRKFKNVA